MSSEPQSTSIFKKSNLFYIPLSITIAHILNFIVNSPLSVWQEFPPKLPNSVYSSIFFTPLLLFISLTFKPIQTRTRFYILLSLALTFISTPIFFHEGDYPAELNNAFMGYSSICGMKMLLFLKLNRAYLNGQKKSKEFRSYLSSLFYWRTNPYIIPPKSKNSNEKESSLIIESPTTSQINKKLIDRFVIIIIKWLSYEFARFISTKDPVEIPDKAYQIRLVEFVTKGIFPVTMFSMVQYVSFAVFMYFWLSIYYDITTIIVAIIYRFFIHSPTSSTSSTSEKINHKSILIKSGILTLPEYVSLNEWMVTFLFNTKHLFNEPYTALSPRDFWSVRWHLLFSEVFKELGYIPARDLIAPYVPRRIANIIGVLGGFGFSALLHEYLAIGQLDIWTGESFFFFISHGVILILWEIVFGYEDRIKITKVRRISKWILFMAINLLILPAFIEPMKRHFELLGLPSFFAQYYMN